MYKPRCFCYNVGQRMVVLPMKRVFAVLFSVLTLLSLPPARALAEGESEAAPYSAAAVSAADAAEILRRGEDAPGYDTWLRATAHTTAYNPPVKVATALLKYLVGKGGAPCAPAPIAFTPCFDVPLPAEGETLYTLSQCNLHGGVFTQDALASVSIRIEPYDSADTVSASVTFNPSDDVHAYYLDSAETLEGKSLEESVNFALLRQGKHRMTITAKTAGGAEAELYSAAFQLQKETMIPLKQSNFSDNYAYVAEFFRYDTDAFLMKYKWNGARNINTATAWREAYLVDSGVRYGREKLGRVHKEALPYFQKAYEYLESSYIRLTVGEKQLPVMQLQKLIKTCGAYVPRFQTNERYVSHHTLGTSVDINAYIYPNTNVFTNQELIGADVRDYLVYNGIKTDEKGQQYYDFTYTGSYKGRYERIPTTLLNYFLYELAFFRAGFKWGYYFETSCDAMHFTLTDVAWFLHSSPDRGLRKVYEYYN